MEPAPHIDEYDDELVGLLQLVWGEGFMAPGGPPSVSKTVAGVELEGVRVLDVGCGIGGADLVLARDHGALVTGIDVEPPLLERARRLVADAGLSDRVDFRLGDGTGLPFENGTFDHVFTHAALIHVDDKPAMFTEILRVLRPGGWLLAYDWLKGPETFTPEMLYWFELEGLTYVMDDLAGYMSTLADVGFVDVSGEDAADAYREVAHIEYRRMLDEWHDQMTSSLGPERRDHFIEDWRVLTVVLDQGQLRPAYFRGRRPEGDPSVR